MFTELALLRPEHTHILVRCATLCQYYYAILPKSKITILDKFLSPQGLEGREWVLKLQIQPTCFNVPLGIDEERTSSRDTSFWNLQNFVGFRTVDNFLHFSEMYIR